MPSPTGAVSARGCFPVSEIIDLSQLGKKRAPQPPPEAVEVYPSEMPKIKAALKSLEDMFARKVVDDPLAAAEAFNQAAGNVFHDLGFIVEVEWFEAKENPYGEAKMHIPRVSIAGRVRRESEVDHDRMRHDVVTGLADGRPGYIREDGTEHEDPIRKVIT